MHNQDAFNLDFSTNHIPFTLSSSYIVAKEDLLYVSKKVGTDASIYQIFVFCSIVEEQYISTCNYGLHSMLLGVAATISKLKLDFIRRGKGVSRTLDDLFREYMKYISLLIVAADQWGFYLPSLFFQALNLYLQGYVTLHGHKY